MPVEQTPTRRGLPWPPPGEEFLARPGRAVGWASLLLALVALGALLIPAGPLALDSRWSELMQDIETSFLTHVALVFNALGHGVWRALTIAGIGIVLLVARRWAALIAFAFTEALTPLLVNLIKLAVGRERPPGQMLERTWLVLPFRPRRLRRRDRCRARAPLQRARPATALVARRGRRGDRLDGLEPHLPAGALALRRGRRRNPRRRGNAPLFRGRPDRPRPGIPPPDGPWLSSVRPAGALNQPRRAGRAMSARASSIES